MSLPSGWIEASISQVADAKLGKMLDAAKNKGEPVRYLRNVNVRWGEFDLSDLQEMRVTPDELQELGVRDNDLFVCEGGEPGRSAIWRGGSQKLVFQKALHRLRALGEMQVAYLAEYLRFVAGSRSFSELLTGTTIKHLPQVALQRLMLPVPPASEQHRIVAKLDAVTARLARARAELNRVSALAPKLRDAALTSLTNEMHGYPAMTIGELAAMTFDGPFGSNLKSADYKAEGIRVVRLENIGHLTFIADKRTFISEEKFATLTRHQLEKNDILFSSFVDREVRVCRFPGTEGRKAINKADCFVIRVDASVCDVDFLTYVLAAPATYEIMRAKVHGATRPRIGLSQLRTHKIHLPPIDLQRKLARQLQAVFARADRVEAEAKRARGLIDRLESAILAKAFRGELVQQDPNDEPASELLDRIRAELAAEPKLKRGRYVRA